jgi:hypothetical protein
MAGNVMANKTNTKIIVIFGVVIVAVLVTGIALILNAVNKNAEPPFILSDAGAPTRSFVLDEGNLEQVMTEMERLRHLKTAMNRQATR